MSSATRTAAARMGWNLGSLSHLLRPRLRLALALDHASDGRDPTVGSAFERRIARRREHEHPRVHDPTGPVGTWLQAKSRAHYAPGLAAFRDGKGVPSRTTTQAGTELSSQPSGVRSAEVNSPRSTMNDRPLYSNGRQPGPGTNVDRGCLFILEAPSEARCAPRPRERRRRNGRGKSTPCQASHRPLGQYTPEPVFLSRCRP